MSRYLSITEYAKSQNVSRQAVYDAIKAGRVVKFNKGIDPDHPTNAYFAANLPKDRQKHGRPAVQRSRTVKRSPPDQTQTGRTAGIGRVPTKVDGITKVQAETIKKIEEIKKLQLEQETKRNNLVPRKFVKWLFSQIYQIDSSEWMSLADKAAPQILSKIGIADEEVTMQVKDIINTEVFNSLKHLKRKIEDALLSIGEKIEEENQS